LKQKKPTGGVDQALRSGVQGSVEFNRMDRFVSTFTNKIDAKGRVSVPASFRAVLERDGYTQGSTGGIYCYPSLDAPALDAGGQSLASKIDRLLDGLPDYSDERDELSVALYGDVHILSLDQDGRIVLPEALCAHAGLSTSVTFVGLGTKFQMWEPARFAERRARAREKVQDHRRLFGAGSRLVQGDGGGEGGARE
jgi:MraZ protein